MKKLCKSIIITKNIVKKINKQSNLLTKSIEKVMKKLDFFHKYEEKIKINTFQ